MTKFQANGFEIDDDDPQVPLIALRAAYYYAYEIMDHSREGTFAINMFMERLGIPMHILAETDQELHG